MLIFVWHPLQVCVEGRLYLEFMFDDMMRIKTWHFSIRQHREIVPRSVLAMHVREAAAATTHSDALCGLAHPHNPAVIFTPGPGPSDAGPAV